MSYKSHRYYVLARRFRLCLGLGVLCLLFALPSGIYAKSIIAIHDWDTTPDPNTWGADGSSASVSVPNDGGDDYLQISFPGGIDSGPGSQWYETVSTPATDLFTGTWITDFWIEFDFWADDAVPDTLQIRWGDNESGRTWGNTIDTSGVGIDSWGSLSSDTFSDVENWRIDPFATQSEFLSDLDSIDWIGVYIFRDGTDAEVYGVDDYKLMVPEPAEYLLLFAALGTALVAMRRRKNSLVVVET